MAERAWRLALAVCACACAGAAARAWRLALAVCACACAGAAARAWRLALAVCACACAGAAARAWRLALAVCACACAGAAARAWRLALAVCACACAGAAARAWRLALAVCACACAGAAAPDALATLGALLPPAVANNFDELIRAASVTCEALPLELLLSRPFSYEIPSTELVAFSNGTRRVYRVTSAHQQLECKPAPLVLYVPGWWNTPTDESSTAIVQALLTKHPLVLVLDTRLSFGRGYVASVSRVSPLSNLLFNFIKNLHKGGFKPSAIHIIGFSLGAHVAGMTGKLVKRRLNTKLGRITALDPAKPCFARNEFKLDKRDAEFVQVIHSSTGVLGLEEPIGHTDVYVNGVGKKQPECQDRSISLECDHAQAWRLFSASAMDDKSLMGKKCASWEELVGNRCSGDETVLGYGCSSKSQGMFLYTSEEGGRLERRQEPQLTVFNPFNLFKGWTFR